MKPHSTQKSCADDSVIDTVSDFVPAEWGSEVDSLSKPRISDLGGLCLNRAMASSMAVAFALHGRVVATSLTQQWTHWKL
jgi:hypothetical protein